MALPLSPYQSSFLPQRPLFGSPSSVSSGGGASMATYQQRARELLARAGTRSGGGGGTLTASAMRSVSEDQTLGQVIGSNIPTVAAGAAFGAIDNSEMGRSIKQFTGGMAEPSTIAFVLGMGLRAFKIDESRPSIRKANNAVLKTMFPLLGYKLGERLVKGSLGTTIKHSVTTVTKKVQAKPATPPKKAGIAGTPGTEIPVPGERTTT
jgi:hypothetical protein